MAPKTLVARAKRHSRQVVRRNSSGQVNAEAVAMLGLPEDNNDLSSRDNFRRIYWDQPPDGLYLVAAVQPHRMNERLTIQQGLFLCANHALFSFRSCLAALLLRVLSARLRSLAGR
jgi:hypothetical protein